MSDFLNTFANKKSERDWEEDFSHENGNYMNNCIFCKQTFTGHKRRVVCKLCDLKPEEEIKSN